MVLKGQDGLEDGADVLLVLSTPDRNEPREERTELVVACVWVPTPPPLAFRPAGAVGGSGLPAAPWSSRDGDGDAGALTYGA